MIVGWFIFLFCLELALRMFLGLIALILSKFRGRENGSVMKDVINQNEENEEEVVEKAEITESMNEVKKVKFEFEFKAGKEL